MPLGARGGFHPGETWLIGTSLVVGLFLFGMLLATARNDGVVFAFFAVHARWRLVGTFAFIGLWAFNHVRFAEGAADASLLSPPRR